MSDLILHFTGDSSEQGQLASDLHDELSEVDHLTCRVIRARIDTQDAGTLLSVALAGPAVVALVKGVAAWLVRRNQSKVDLELPDGSKITIRNMESADVAAAIKGLEGVVR